MTTGLEASEAQLSTWPEIHDPHNVGSELTLSLVNLEQSISKLSITISKAPTTEYVLERLLHHCQCATPFESASETTKESEQTREKVHKSIIRFLREPDRWTALTSVLLKSIAFHRSVQELPQVMDDIDRSQYVNLFENQSNSETEIKMLPIVDLPRTKFNRPYIPYLSSSEPRNKIADSTNTDEGQGINENPTMKISVSHQYPHIAIVQSSSSLKLGMDIVIFEFQRNEFTPTTNDFLKSFESSFTPWEWERIQYCSRGGIFKRRVYRSEEAKLKEFFLRWAIKEAYTKALGLGMNMEFSSFETRLHGIDKLESDATESIWETFSMGLNTECNRDSRSSTLMDCPEQCATNSGSCHQYSVLGDVFHLPSKDPNNPVHSATPNELWEFIFVPISKQAGTSNDACCCVCRGPFSSPNRNVKAKVGIEHLDLLDLINLHKKQLK